MRQVRGWWDRQSNYGQATMLYACFVVLLCAVAVIAPDALAGRVAFAATLALGFTGLLIGFFVVAMLLLLFRHVWQLAQLVGQITRNDRTTDDE